ncbi:MAG: PHP domain-containing protein [Candidatus Cloacimonetes bacterium]|nr:PHP domain-containing protein [Candidatus Cloacimonadota bacterium]
MKSNINFHIHSTYSDGTKTVPEIVKEIETLGIKWFAITDHDQVKGNIEAAELAVKYGLNYTTGIELSCCFDGEAGLDETCVCHIVGLGIDIAKMQIEILKIEEEKDRILHELFCELVKDSYMLKYENVLTNDKIIERKSISNELIRQGYATNANDAFSNILNTDKYRHFAKNIPTIKKGIEIIKQCGGVAVWAHPFGITRGGKKEITEEQVLNLIEYMLEYGIEAIEVYYQLYDVQQIQFLEALATTHKLWKSIGTDYHGIDPLPCHSEARRILFPKEILFFEKEGIQVDESIIAVFLS